MNFFYKMPNEKIFKLKFIFAAITLHDHNPPETPPEVEIGRDQDYYASTNTLVNNCYGKLHTFPQSVDKKNKKCGNAESF